MNKKKIITHNGQFHADDVFAVATLLLHLNDKAEVVRTRDKKTIKTGNFVVDTGFVYDEQRNLFDHHQEGRAGERPNGVPYASFGSVWKKFGRELCGSDEIMKLVDKNLAQPIDAFDNGITLYETINGNTDPLLFMDVVNSFNSTLDEGDDKNDENFIELVNFAKRVIQREIVKSEFYLKQKKRIKKLFDEAEDKRYIVLDVPITSMVVISLLNEYKEPLFFVVPAKQDVKWKIRTVLTPPKSFKSRKLLPKQWAGKTGKDLAEITGVEDAMFCHNERFIAVAGSKEGAVALVKKALEA